MSAGLPGDEVWKPIPGHPNYEASDHGRVRNARNGHVLKPQSTGKNGYLKVDLGARASMTIQRAVALAHLPLPCPLPMIGAWHADHEDFNRHNNRASNLRWLPAPENRHRYARHLQEAPPEVEEPPMSDAEVEAALTAGGWA